MTCCYKWTDAQSRTTAGAPPDMRTLQWGEGVTHTADPWAGKLCGAGVIHCYDDPLVAVVLDLAHGGYTAAGDACLWECEWTGRTVAAPDKRGAEKLTTLRVIDAPVIATEQRVEIALRACLVVLPAWAALPDQAANATACRAWWGGWLAGTDRSGSAADAAGRAVAAAWSTAYAAGRAAEAAWEADIPLDLVGICREVVGAASSGG